MPSFTQDSPLNRLAALPLWAQAGDMESAILLSTRVRIARNLAGEPFPHKLDTEGRINVVRSVAKIVSVCSFADAGMFLSLATLTPLELALLAERRLISPQIQKDDRPRGAFIWFDADRALLVCEEDHLRLCEIQPGLSARQCFANLSPLMDELAGKLPLAWDEELGYLTARPTNLRDSTRTSLHCHLPGLVITNGIHELGSALSTAGFRLKGVVEDGSEVLGCLFQVSDGPGLSYSLEERTERIEKVARELQEREAMARIELQTRHPALLRDRVARSLAVLQKCQLMSFGEATSLLSGARLGLDLGWIDGVQRAAISMLTFELSRPYLDWHGAPKQAVDERQQRRAARCREIFAKAEYTG